MLKKYLIVLPFLLLTFWKSEAQLRYGLKVGMNYSTIKSTNPEQDANGNNLENYNYSSGFHVGFATGYSLAKFAGIRLEVLYSQKGAEYTYTGPAFRTLTTNNGVKTFTTGSSAIKLSITNQYIDVPLMAYLKFKRFEVSAGVNAAFLMASSGTGEMFYETTINALNRSVTIPLRYNYIKDEFGGLGSPSGTAQSFTVASQTYVIPGALGAYYDYSSGDGKFYNRLDWGLNAGAAIYLSSTLYIGGRLNYGLGKINNPSYDFYKSKTNAQAPIAREDKRTNYSLQASLGFNF